MTIKRIHKTFFIIFIFLILIKKVFSIEAHQKLLNTLEKNYPLEAIFEQTYKDKKTEGWMVIKGNGMARTEFAPPNNNIIVADGKWIIFYDPEIDRTTYIPLDTGILEALLNPQTLKKNKNFKVNEQIDNNIIKFDIGFNLENKNQKVVISFDRKNNNLLGWKLYESKNDFISVKLINKKKLIQNKKITNKFFKLLIPSIQTDNIYMGPYTNRKFKKILGGGKLNK